MYHAILVTMTALGVLLFSPISGYTGFLPSLPYPGPFEGQVLDRNTNQPIPDAQMFCHWSCADLPIPHAPGEVHHYAKAMSDASGRYRIERSSHRGGFAGCSFSITCKATGYIDVVLIGGPPEPVLPLSTQAWPFAETRIQEVIPERLDFSMKPALAILLKALKSDNSQYRQVAAEQLGHLGSDAQSAVPSLALAMIDADAEVRRRAVKSLGMIAPQDQTVLTALIAALKDPDMEIRESSLKSLVQSGPAAAHAFLEVSAMLQDQEPVVRRRVPAALAAIGSGERRAIPALMAALRDEDSRTRQEAGYTLGHMRDEHLPEMIEFLCNENPLVRKTVANILITRNQSGRLREAIQTQNPVMRLAAVKHLACLAREKEEFIPALVDIFADDHPEIKAATVAILAELGAPAQPFLLEALKTGNPSTHSAAAAALLPGRTTKLVIESEVTNNLIQAILRRSTAEVVSRLSLGVDINVAGPHGFTPLMAAAGRKRVEIINLLLALGADVHAVDDSGCSALMYAARAGNNVGTQILLERGAIVNIRDQFDQTALVYAARGNALSVMDILLNQDADSKYRGEALYYAALDGRMEAVKYLLDHNADLESQNKDGNTPLMAAVLFGRDATVQYLLDEGAKINAQNRYGWSALMIASQGGHQTVVKLLLAAGADLKQMDLSGRTARNFAIAGGHSEIAEMLK